ncbi:MAG: hypothetical protein IJP29_05795 [Lachnospiraceae bacterium]|nr:hypothetical protein [Lachnospiraceae bacterium]
MWFYVCAGTVVVLAIITIVNYIKSGDVSRLNPGVVEMLKNTKRRPFEERDEAKEKNRKRARMNLGLLCVGMVPCFVLVFFGIFAKTIVGEQIAGGLLLLAAFIAIFVVATVLLLWRDNRKLARDKDVYVLKAYLMGVKQGHNVRTAFFAYYDDLQDKCVSVNVTLDGKDVSQLQRGGQFVDVLVAEKKNKVKFVDLKR